MSFQDFMADSDLRTDLVDEVSFWMTGSASLKFFDAYVFAYNKIDDLFTCNSVVTVNF